MSELMLPLPRSVRATAIGSTQADADADARMGHRLRLLSGDLATDELMVALGLVVAGLAPNVAPEASTNGHGFASSAWVQATLDGGAEHRKLVYDLWYRTRVAYERVPVDRWYLLTLALRRAGGDVAGALDVFSEAREALWRGEDTADVYARVLDVTGPPVVARHEQDGDALVEAVRQGVPLAVSGDPVPVNGADAPVRPPDEPTFTRAGLRAEWSALSSEDKLLLLRELHERIAALEQVRFIIDGELRDNLAVAELLLSLTRVPIEDWSLGSLSLASLVWLWRDAGTVLQEFNQTLLCPSTIGDVIGRRIRDYEAVLGEEPEPLPRGIVALARLLARRRTAIDRDHYRCLQFDGGNWERREFLVTRQSCLDLTPIPADLRAALADAFGTEVAGAGPDFWQHTLDTALACDRTPTDVCHTLADWVAQTDSLYTDYAIFTAPYGVKLQSPWELDITDVFCWVGFRPGFDPKAHGIPLDYRGIWNLIGQRMRYNVVKKAQNYTLVRRFKAQSFNLPDIAVAEDANHAGHRASGIRLSCRIPTHLRIDDVTWKGLADIRLSRAEYRRDREFRPSEVPMATRYAIWWGWLAEAVYQRGLLFDKTYCDKL